MDVIKILLTTPIMWILYGLIGALVLLKGMPRNSRVKKGWYLLLAVTLLFFLMSLPISVDLARYSLARTYVLPTQEVLKTLDAIVILGGGIEVGEGLNAQAQPSPATFSRVQQGVATFKQSGAKQLILSGGPPKDQEDAPSEASVMRTLAIAQGISESKMVLEEVSHNTFEEAMEVAQLLKEDKSVETLGVVTSGVHLPRAIRIFRRRLPQLTLIAVPVGSFQPSFPSTLLDMIPSAHALSVMTDVLHEWIGIIWYALRY